jgi:hypothetical protein
MLAVVGLSLLVGGVHLLAQNQSKEQDAGKKATGAASRTGPRPDVPEPKPLGGEPESVVQVANLVYAGVKSSHCFSDHFLSDAEQASAISTSRRFHAVKLSSQELFGFPFVIMTGEGAFDLPDRERDNLRQYILRGGFLLASAGCSSPDWDRSFRKEMARIFPDQKMAAIPMEHAMFHTVHDIKQLDAKHGKSRQIEGISIAGRLGVVYSQDGLNDTSHTQGCCCCGGNEIAESARINVNILAYALIY